MKLATTIQPRARSLCLLLLAFGLLPACLAQEWELGGVGGFGVFRNLTATGPAGGSAKAGFDSGAAVGAIGAHNLYPLLSGEARYTFRFSDLKAESGQKVTFSGYAHAIHYDLLLHAKPLGERIRPFVAGGGGLKIFRGTGEEQAFQPLDEFVLLTKTQQLKPLISVGGGVKVSLSPRTLLRVEFRDYITPFPKEVVAPSPGAKLDGWLHDFVPMVGITFTFGTPNTSAW